MKARGRESTVRVQTWLNTSQPNRHSVGQLPVAMANTWGSFQRGKLEGLFCWALFCFWLTVSESVVTWSHILLACSCTVPPDKNKNLLCSWKLGSQKYDRGRSHFPIPLGDTPLVMYFPLVGPSSQWFQQLLRTSAWGPSLQGRSKI